MKLKNVFLGLLVLLHLVSTAGFSIDIHECGKNKEYSYLGFSIGESCKCNHSKAIHKKRCCHEKKVTIKADKQDKINKNEIVFKSVFTAIDCKPIELRFNNTQYFSSDLKYYQLEFPPTHSPPIYILHGVFRI